MSLDKFGLGGVFYIGRLSTCVSATSVCLQTTPTSGRWIMRPVPLIQVPDIFRSGRNGELKVMEPVAEIWRRDDLGIVRQCVLPRPVCRRRLSASGPCRRRPYTGSRRPVLLIRVPDFSGPAGTEKTKLRNLSQRSSVVMISAWSGGRQMSLTDRSWQNTPQKPNLSKLVRGWAEKINLL